MPVWAGGRRRPMPSLRPALGALLLVAAAVLAFYLKDPEASPSPGTAIAGPVERVVDGDTVLIAGNRVRLAGLDAPELGQACARADGTPWDCGAAARDRLGALLGRSAVSCGFRRTDRYGRPLVTCDLPDGSDPGAVLVAEGMAVAYGAYVAEEAAARRERLGMWQGQFVRPADWRRDRAGEDPTGNPSRFERLLGWLGQLLGS